MSHLFLEGKSHIMLVHKFMNQSHLSVKFMHHVLIMSLIIHHILTFCYPHVTDRHNDTFQVSASTKVISQGSEIVNALCIVSVEIKCVKLNCQVSPSHQYFFYLGTG